MHEIKTKSGYLDCENEFKPIIQTKSKLLFISSADTELSAIARIWGETFGKKLRLMNTENLQNPITIKKYAENVLFNTKIAIFRLHGGKNYFSRLLNEILSIKSNGSKLKTFVFSGTDDWDHELMSFTDFNEYT